MFFAVDSSGTDSIQVWGGILLPLDKVPLFEDAFLRIRLEHTLFGEIKWQGIDRKYHREYCDFLDLFFKEELATFHSVGFRVGEEKYKAVYKLLQWITWKVRGAGYDKPLMALFDNEGGLAKSELAIIRGLAPADPNFRMPLTYCNQGTSHTLGLLQVADLLTGAVRTEAISSVNRLADYKKYVYDYILARNDGIPLTIYPPRMPRLYKQKMHYMELSPKNPKLYAAS